MKVSKIKAIATTLLMGGGLWFTTAAPIYLF